MDTKFFNDAMKAVGIKTFVIDENTDFGALELEVRALTVQVSVNGGAPISWSEFVMINGFSPVEEAGIRAALLKTGRYEGGGGAGASFVIEVVPAVEA